MESLELFKNWLQGCGLAVDLAVLLNVGPDDLKVLFQPQPFSDLLP